MIASFFKAERETYLLGLLRLGFGTLLLLLTLKRGRELWLNGYFGDVFHLPLWPEQLVPSRSVYAALLLLQTLACVLAILGVAARQALLCAAILGLYGFFCDRLQYHNNRYELLLLTLLVSLAPCDRSFLAFRKSSGGLGPRWAVGLVGVQLSVAYAASSLGKLFDADWRSGQVLMHRFALVRPVAELWWPSRLVDLMTQPWFAHLAASCAIVSEMFLAAGLWQHRTRAPALWLGVMFHLGIELAAHVELFSYTMLCGYLAFVTPELRERRLCWSVDRRLGVSLAALFRRLDLLARFEHRVEAEGPELLVVTDRSGVEHHGVAAWRELSRAVPALFPLWLPLSLLSLRSGVRARTSAAPG